MTISKLIANAMNDLADQLRIASQAWVELDEIARQAEEMKTARFAKLVKDQGEGKPVAAAERDAKATQEWHDYLAEMVKARTRANEARTNLEYVRAKLICLQAGALWPESREEQLGEEMERGAA